MSDEKARAKGKGPPVLRKIRKVLVGVDLSMESAGAVVAARNVAERFDAELHIVHVIEPLSAAAEQAIPELARQHQINAETELRRYIESRDIRPEQMHVRRGAAPSEIHETIAEIDADLLVIGRYGPGGLKRGRFGSIAGPLIRTSRIPLLLAQPERRDPYERVFVATDLDERPDRELIRGLQLAERFGASELAVIHTFPVPHGYHMVLSWDECTERLTRVYQERAEKARERALAAHRALGGKNVPVRFLIEEGSPSARVPEIAQREKADLLVLNPHARSTAARLLLPPVAEQILSAAPCSIWAERDPSTYEGVLAALRRIVD